MVESDRRKGNGLELPGFIKHEPDERTNGLQPMNGGGPEVIGVNTNRAFQDLYGLCHRLQRVVMRRASYADVQ